MMQDKKIQLMKPNVGEHEIELVKKVINSGYLTEGPMVREFETKVAEYIGVKYAIACTSATVGLELSLRALGVGPGDEVIVPDFTHPATALAVMTVGAKPVLVDVELESRNTNAELIEEAITEKTRATIPVSLFGNPLEMDRINKLRDKYSISIIEDAACSLGSEINGKKVGSLTDLTVFSFHPRKVFTTGDGGLITTDNDYLAELIKSMKRFGIGKIDDNKTGFVRWGTNSRMSDIHGAIALGQIRRIDDILRDRIEKAKIYYELLENVEGIEVPIYKPHVKTNFQTYAIYIKKDGMRDKIMKELRNKNIEVQIGTYALHTQPVFKNVRKIGELKNSYVLYKNLLALPLHHELTLEDQERIVYELKKVLKKH